MRIRTVKPEFWQDEDLSEISETARLVAIGLLNCADDEGFFNANERLVKSSLFPLTDPSVSIHECFKQLSECGYLKLYECIEGKKTYGHVVNFLKHQKVNRPSPSKIKPLVDFTDYSLNHHGAITSGKEQGKEQGSSTSVEVVSYIPFEDFWKIYPKKVDRKPCQSKWKSLKITQEVFVNIKKHLSVAYAQTEKQFIPSPKVYLGNEKWNDEILTSTSGSFHQQPSVVPMNSFPTLED